MIAPGDKLFDELLGAQCDAYIAVAKSCLVKVVASVFLWVVDVDKCVQDVAN